MHDPVFLNITNLITSSLIARAMFAVSLYPESDFV
jgi:hypothetical protein